jgi:phosphonate transport system substrate-binding protein
VSEDHPQKGSLATAGRSSVHLSAPYRSSGDDCASARVDCMGLAYNRTMDLFRVALPPSTVLERVPIYARAFTSLIGPVVGRSLDVTVSHNYDVLARNVLSGAVDLAWAPPFVCARTEPDGAQVLAQAIRGGQASYACAFVTVDDRRRTLASLRGLHVAFVDENSVAGHLLAVAHLKERVLDPTRFFGRVTFAGSYRAALAMLDEGKADVACVHALPDDPQSARRAVAAHLPTHESAFHVVEVTASTPSEALILSPHTADSAGALVGELVRILTTMQHDPAGQVLLEQLFLAERFARAERGAYRALYRLAPR